jgi:site-specific DNA-methyltransferase (adenine-specific)
MKLHLIKPAKGSIKTKKRLGRGSGSGRGGTSTKGHKGDQSRSGYKRKIGFKGEDNDFNRSDRSNITGRFPANLIHDNSEEVRECFPESTSGARKKGDHKEYDASSYKFGGLYSEDAPAESGNASRFFKSIVYIPKASKSERNKGCEGLEDKFRAGLVGADRDTDQPLDDVSERFRTQPAKNNHPTVKPIALMEYLIKMVTKPGGIVLDPFAGSGSTLVAAKQNGFKYIGIELTEEYIPIIEARLNYTNPHFTFL